MIGGFARAALFVLCLGVVLLADLLTGDALTRRLGIEPRALNGLDGMLFAPLLHGDLGHYLSNAMPLIVLLVLSIRRTPAEASMLGSVATAAVLAVAMQDRTVSRNMAYTICPI